MKRPEENLNEDTVLEILRKPFQMEQQNFVKQKLELILRGRFLGYRINPLMPITERSITYNPLPELGWALQLVRLHKREEM